MAYDDPDWKGPRADEGGAGAIPEIHPGDAADAGVTDGAFVEVRSRRGVFIAQARVTSEIARGVCFAPFHWGRAAGLFKAANNLTTRARDPVSGQPELKFCAVNVTPVIRFDARRIEQGDFWEAGAGEQSNHNS